MRTIWQVIKHDVAATLRQRSFWVLTLLMPALLIGLQAYYAIQDGGLSGTDYDPSKEAERNAPKAMASIGLVDEAGLIAELPADFPPGLFVRFADQAGARAALDAREVGQYVYVPADYVASGQVNVYTKEFQIIGGESEGLAFDSSNEWVLAYLLDYNLTGDRQLAAALRNPTPANLAQPHDVSPAATTSSEAKALAGMVSSVMPYIFYFLLIMGSSYLMRSVVAEKENRTAEVLLLSLNPRDLLVGKILAMSLIVVVQLVFWVGGGVLILNKGADLLRVASFNFPPGFFLWAALFLILGYLLFAAVMAAGGAISSNARETGAMTFLLVIPLMPTLMFGRLFAEEPNSPLVVGLSLFPFSAPSAMVTRLAIAPVPWWQLLISLAGLAVTTYLFVLLAARFFQAGNLLSSASFSWRRLATGWRK
ncbi:MAG: ABC transporter permease [Anaerolineae bacterium]|nr:ABC transporter permease [Anaerolineae bacterium]